MSRQQALQFCTGAVLGALGSNVASRAYSRIKLRRLLGANYSILSHSDRRMVGALVQAGHSYLLQHWPPPGTKDREKRNLVQHAAAQLGANTEALRTDVLEKPRAAKKPHTVEAPHGKQRSDPYYWLRDDDREAPEVLEYLKAEAEYTKAVMADTEELQASLFKELRGRIQETDQSAPLRKGDFFWYKRTEEGKQYAVYCRRACPPGLASPSEDDTMDLKLPEEILLDANEEAKAHSFYMLGSLEVSPDQTKIAYECDITGNEKYQLYVRDIATGKQQLSHPVPNTAGGIAWSKDNSTIFYVTKDEVLRPDKVWRHTIGQDYKDDVVVFHETDPSFNVGVYTSRSKGYIFIETSAAVTSETRFLDASDPTGEFKVVLPRINDVEYEVADWNSSLFIKIRDVQRPNSELVVAPFGQPDQQTVLVQHSDRTMLEDFVISKHHLVLLKRENGQQTAQSFELPRDSSALSSLENGSTIRFEEAVYALRAGEQGDYDSEVLRVVYSSLTTPSTTIDQHLGTQKRCVKKVDPVLGGFDSSAYKSQRLWASAEDGVKVPLSVVYKEAAVNLDGTDPLLLDGYGSYGICNDPRFDRDLISLLDRGFIYAIAHVRGGGELGRQWYEDGKFKKKRNTFTDFIAAAEHLVDQKFTTPKKLCIQGRSAGGLTMGAVVNMRPDLFQAAIFGVPFVDVVTTMLDESIPLTTGEFEEWGNPAQPRSLQRKLYSIFYSSILQAKRACTDSQQMEKDYYDYMLSYSPVDQIQATSYPHILVLAGLHDPRVAYWEPAKYTAKLRDLKTDKNMLLFKCDMGAGHFSQSGRFDQLHDVALEQAFLLKAAKTVRT